MFGYRIHLRGRDDFSSTRRASGAVLVQSIPGGVIAASRARQHYRLLESKRECGICALSQSRTGAWAGRESRLHKNRGRAPVLHLSLRELSANMKSAQKAKPTPPEITLVRQLWRL